MADQRHLDILAQGVDVWNRWRQDNPECRPDLKQSILRGSNLSEADLSKANLSRADLNMANLIRANLTGANLIWANLSEANLTAADLSGANLTGANLMWANLTEADLLKADLSWAKLLKANLTGADLSEARLTGADLSWANLSKANLIEARLSEAHLTGANLTEANLSEAHLVVADLSGANLTEARFSGADLSHANLSEADLSHADFIRADLSHANLTGANLTGANLHEAELHEAELTGANLTEANLIEASLVRANLTKATLTRCRVYGVSAWAVNLGESHQTDIVITPYGEPPITIDNLEVAQFVYLLLNNQKLRNVIDTITSRVVLILGRFSDDQKPVLDAIKKALRQRGFCPILFDFEGSSSRDVGETVLTLAHLARYVVADITDPKGVPQELQSIVPNLPSLPVQPILRGSGREYGMFEHLQRYPWVLDIHRYGDETALLESLGGIITNLERKWYDLRGEPQLRLPRKRPVR